MSELGTYQGASTIMRKILDWTTGILQNSNVNDRGSEPAVLSGTSRRHQLYRQRNIVLNFIVLACLGEASVK
jgi:hypothetical protein